MYVCNMLDPFSCPALPRRSSAASYVISFSLTHTIHTHIRVYTRCVWKTFLLHFLLFWFVNMLSVFRFELPAVRRLGVYWGVCPFKRCLNLLVEPFCWRCCHFLSRCCNIDFFFLLLFDYTCCCCIGSLATCIVKSADPLVAVVVVDGLVVFSTSSIVCPHSHCTAVKRRANGAVSWLT